MADAMDSSPGGEAVLLRTRPGLAFVALYRPAWLVPALLVLGLVVLIGLAPVPLPRWAMLTLLVVAAAWIVAYFAWGVLEWLSRAYLLTDRRITVGAGVVGRAAADIPLRNVQHVTATQSVLERLLGLGTVGVATAGSDGPAIRWLMVADSARLMQMVRDQVDRAQGAAPPASPPARARRRPVVIGLAGGIGAGKSEVAAILARRGCVVSDSDAESRAAMDRPEVRRQVQEWWGTGMIGADGRVDRRALARVVFADPAERRRLEGLIHPLVRRSRDEALQRAADQGARALVIDAPLLFEAGVNKECDAVIFVDAPREQRLERVRSTRGWDDAELARREAAQMPTKEKRARSQEVVLNDGPRDRLENVVSRALESILSRASSSGPGGVA